VGTNEKAPSRAGARKEALTGSGNSSGGPGSVADPGSKGPAQEPIKRAPDTTTGCYVNGTSVSEFRVLIDGQAAAVITRYGVWVFSRIYYDGAEPGGKYVIGDERSDTVGGQKLQGIEFDTRTGLTLHFSQYDVHVPAQWCKASWRRPA
jgi:hypothetical protein